MVSKKKGNGMLTFIDLFAGIGGFRLAFQQQGFKCVFTSEIDPACQQTYFENHGDHPHGDITKVPIDDLPNFDVLVGGFPCQPFSISGKKMGFVDTRGTLFFDICRIIKAKEPKTVVLENVQHLVHHDQGRTLKVILESLKELGYKVDYQILNAKDFGVPQHRERIFIIGSKEGYFNFQLLEKQKTPTLRSFLDKDGDFEFLDKKEYTLIKNPRPQPKSGLIFVGYRNKNTWKVGIRPNTEHLSRVHRQPNRIYSVDGVHPTLPSQETSGRFFIYDSQKGTVRKLTITECYKLMGFPADFKRNPALGSSYLQIGNSVCVPLCAEIARVIKNKKGFVDEPQGKVSRELQQVFLY